jgi:hypothetical protein
VEAFILCGRRHERLQLMRKSLGSTRLHDCDRRSTGWLYDNDTIDQGCLCTPLSQSERCGSLRGRIAMTSAERHMAVWEILPGGRMKRFRNRQVRHWCSKRRCGRPAVGNGPCYRVNKARAQRRYLDTQLRLGAIDGIALE